MDGAFLTDGSWAEHTLSPKLWAYQATIILAERNYEGKWWVTYDRQYRRQSLARKDLNWSVTDPCLYNEAFTGRALSLIG